MFSCDLVPNHNVFLIANNEQSQGTKSLDKRVKSCINTIVEAVGFEKMDPRFKTVGQMLQQFKDAGVTKVFCGHYHRNAGGWDEDLEVVVTSAIGAQIGNDGHGMRIVKVTEDKITHEYFKLEDIPLNNTQV